MDWQINRLKSKNLQDAIIFEEQQQIGDVLVASYNRQLYALLTFIPLKGRWPESQRSSGYQ